MKRWYKEHKAKLPWWQRRLISGVLQLQNSQTIIRSMVEAMGSQERHLQDVERRKEKRLRRKQRRP